MAKRGRPKKIKLPEPPKVKKPEGVQLGTKRGKYNIDPNRPKQVRSKNGQGRYKRVGIHRVNYKRTKKIFDTVRYEVWVDLDDTLVDLATPLCEHFGVNNIEELKRNIPRPQIDYFFKNCDVAFWTNLKWTNGGPFLWNTMNEYNDFKVTVISVYNGWNTAYMGKIKWIHNNLGYEFVSKAILMENREKEIYAKPNRILIDDYYKNTDAWAAKGGLIIPFDGDGQKAVNRLKEMTFHKTISLPKHEGFMNRNYYRPAAQRC
jgi:hypothetical protein